MRGLCLKYFASSCRLEKKGKKVNIKGLEWQGLLNAKSLHCRLISNLGLICLAVQMPTALGRISLNLKFSCWQLLG